MRHTKTKQLLFLFIFSLLLNAAFAQVKEPANTDPDWSKHYEPFRIAGNLYYVGTYDLASYLITTPAGNILINTGLASSEEDIRGNIEKLGFRFSDIKILLNTQAHYDHLGAMAAIKEKTGAQLMVEEQDKEVCETGGSADYELAHLGQSFRPVTPDRLLHDHDKIRLGDMMLTVLHHPGHTKGSCSFIFSVKDEQKSYRVLIANMPTIITEKKFGDIKEYPSIAKDYGHTLRKMEKLKFDLWVASHASQFDLHKKHRPGDPYNLAAFAGRADYDEELQELEKKFEAKLSKDAGSK